MLGNQPGRRTGYQIVIGKEFEVQEFVQALEEGQVTIKSDQVAIMVGTDMLHLGVKINLGNRLGKLIKHIRVSNPITQFWVTSVLPRPLAGVVFDDMIQKVNKTISNMCCSLDKYKEVNVTYVPIHCEFL